MWEEFRRTRPFNTQELQLASIAHIGYMFAGGEASLEEFIPSISLAKKSGDEETKMAPEDLDLALRGMFK